MKISDFNYHTKINEVDPNTLAGSDSTNLNECREFCLEKLKQIQTTFDTIYVLGSWYGNFSMMIENDEDISFDRIINVELDEEALNLGQKIIKSLGYEFIHPLHKDANELSYHELGKNGLVVNQSCNNIKGDDWFNNIPKGATVLLTARNNDPGEINTFNSVFDLVEKYSVSTILYADKAEFEDHQTEYEYYILIGIK